MEINEVKTVNTVNTVDNANATNEVKTVSNPADFRNKKTAAQLMREEGAGLDFYPGKKNPNNLRFVCGTKAGYVSKHITENLDNVQVEDVRYAEIKAVKDGKEVWIPTLFLAAVKVKAIKHFSL